MPLTEYFDIQAQAASALGESLDTLREAKRQGCPAFRSGRVYRKELIGWLATHRQASGLADDPTRLRHRRLKVDTERAEWEFERQRDRHLPVSQFEKALAAMLTAFNTGLSNFAGRVNPRLQGLDFDARTEVLEDEIDILRRSLAQCDYLEEEPKPIITPPAAGAHGPRKKAATKRRGKGTVAKARAKKTRGPRKPRRKTSVQR